MLKAIRFDEEKHKEILQWLKNFRDKKGKENESEAARYLMQQGIEYIIYKQSNELIKEPKNINSDDFKRELMNEVRTEVMNEFMNEVNNKMLGGLTAFVDKLNNFQIQPQVIVQQPIPTSNTQYKEPIEKPIEKPIDKPKINKKHIAIEGNNLLANILGNVNR